VAKCHDDKDPAAVARPNLAVSLNTTALKVLTTLTSTGTVTATGVQVQYANGTQATLCANKEVILSSGTVQSPGLLELSGIGDPAILQVRQVSHSPGL
jgi:choline dehydrogenase-like flavoprotein